MPPAVHAPTTLKELPFETALAHLDEGAAFVDLRPTDDYLDVHVPGSIALGWESGPGITTRARDCIPLDVPLVLLNLGVGDLPHAAASLRGKGFDVVGTVEDAINEWAERNGTPASTETYRGPQPHRGMVLHVGDVGVPEPEGALFIPIEKLWHRVSELADEPRVYVAAGYGIRAGMGVGMLERAGVDDIVFWRSR